MSDIITSRAAWPAIGAAGLATFSVVTTEMLPVGLLTPIADSLSVSTGQAGWLISLPAALAALFAPLVVVAARGLNRRTVLIALLALLAAANLASALATTLTGMLAARVVVGLCMGGIWAVAGGLAARLAPPQAVGLATAVIFGGVAAASVLGVPLGAWLGEMAGWRWAFASMAVLSALVLGMLSLTLPSLPVAGATRWRQFRVQWQHAPLQRVLWLTLVLVAGHFMAFTFMRPLLATTAGLDAAWISALLFLYGAAGLAGNFLTGAWIGRRPATVLLAIAVGLLCTPLAWLALAGQSAGVILVLLGWGVAYGGVSVGLMNWVMRAAPQAVEVATALYVSVFNVGIGLGAWLGGTMVDTYGWRGNLWAAAGVATGAALLAVRVVRADRQRHGARDSAA